MRLDILCHPLIIYTRKETEYVHRETRKVLEKAENKVAKHRENSQIAGSVPATEELAKITETLDDYASELLPSTRSHNRAESRRSASSASGNGSVHSFRPRRHQPESTSEPAMGDIIRTKESSITTSVSSNHVSSRSSLSPPRASSSFSTVSTPSVNMPNRDVPRSSKAGAVTTERSFRHREYMNDPDGTILSPPIVRPSSSPVVPVKTVQIGDYTIVLEATQLRINSHSLRVNDYSIGLAFCEALKQHPQELESLEKAILRGNEDWEGIPGWLVNPSNWTADTTADGIGDV